MPWLLTGKQKETTLKSNCCCHRTEKRHLCLLPVYPEFQDPLNVLCDPVKKETDVRNKNNSREAVYKRLLLFQLIIHGYYQLDRKCLFFYLIAGKHDWHPTSMHNETTVNPGP